MCGTRYKRSPAGVTLVTNDRQLGCVALVTNERQLEKLNLLFNFMCGTRYKRAPAGGMPLS